MKTDKDETRWAKGAIASATIITSVEEHNPRALYFPAYIMITREAEGLWEYAKKHLPGHPLWGRYVIALFLKAVSRTQAELLVEDYANVLYCHAFPCYYAGLEHPCQVE
jgi:hypothetical protein